jgi:hypothetical protein
MRSSAGLHRHRARQLGGEELEQLRPHQPLAERYMAGRIRPRPMCLENRLRDIQSDRASLPHGRLPNQLAEETNASEKKATSGSPFAMRSSRAKETMAGLPQA